MDELKKEIIKSFRMEMLGAGMYRALARKYKKRQDLCSRLLEFAAHEAAHGKMFADLYCASYGRIPGGEKLWLTAGKVAAFSMAALPLKMKLRMIGAVEAMAVRQIEAALSGGEDTGFHHVIRSILPDEKAHAALYGELF